MLGRSGHSSSIRSVSSGLWEVSSLSLSKPNGRGKPKLSDGTDELPPPPLSREVDRCMSMRAEIEREEDGRSIAEIPAILGAFCYAASKEEALVKVTALALRILPEQNPAGILVRVVYLRRAEIAVIRRGASRSGQRPIGPPACPACAVSASPVARCGPFGRR